MIVSHDPTFVVLRKHLYTTETAPMLGKMHGVEMPTHIISNELDKWILAAIHEVGLELENQMNAYALDG